MMHWAAQRWSSSYISQMCMLNAQGQARSTDITDTETSSKAQQTCQQVLARACMDQGWLRGVITCLLDGRQARGDLLAANFAPLGLYTDGRDGRHLQLPHVVLEHVAAQHAAWFFITGLTVCAPYQAPSPHQRSEILESDLHCLR